MVQYFSDWDGLVLVGVRWRGGGGGAEVVWVEMVLGGESLRYQIFRQMN